MFLSVYFCCCCYVLVAMLSWVKTAFLTLPLPPSTQNVCSGSVQVVTSLTRPTSQTCLCAVPSYPELIRKWFRRNKLKSLFVREICYLPSHWLKDVWVRVALPAERWLPALEHSLLLMSCLICGSFLCGSISHSSVLLLQNNAACDVYWLIVIPIFIIGCEWPWNMEVWIFWLLEILILSLLLFSLLLSEFLIQKMGYIICCLLYLHKLSFFILANEEICIHLFWLFTYRMLLLYLNSLILFI